MAKTLVIKTRMDNSDFDKKYSELVKQLEIAEKEQNAISKKSEEYNSKIVANKEEIKKVNNSMKELKNTIDSLSKKQIGKGLSGSEYADLEKATEEYNKQNKALEKLYDANSKINSQIDSQNIKYQKTTSKIQNINDKIENLKDNGSKFDLSNVSKSMTDIIKKIGKWSLAVIGVSSAYNLITRAVGTLSQYNKGLSDDISYIQFALASTLEPVISRIVGLAYKALQYINYLAQAWFGVNLFANATASAMNKANKSAKELKKSMGSYDTANVLSDSSGGGGGVSTPSVDLSKQLGEDEIPPWIKWLAENGELLKNIILGIGIAFATWKIIELISNLFSLGEKLGIVFDFIGKIGEGLSSLQLVGIAVVIGGIVLLIKDIIGFLNDPTWEGFGKILTDIGIILAGLALIIGSIPLAVAAIIAIIVGLVITNWDKIKEILGIVASWIYENVLTPIGHFFKACFDTLLSVIKLFISGIQAIFTTVVNLVATPFVVAKDTIIGVFNGIKTFFKGFVQVIKSIFNGDIKGVFKGFKTMFSGLMDSLWSIAKAPLNLIIGGLNSLIKGANKISFDVPDWVPGLGGKKFGFNIPTIKKLKVGGIINNPGKGVPVGGAIGGEAGREGVLPLTDAQAMAELGKEIGKWITLYINLTGEMDGRAVLRVLKKIIVNDEFAKNGG